MDVLACCRFAERSTQVVRGAGRAEAVRTSCTLCVLVFEIMVAVAHAHHHQTLLCGRLAIV